MAKGFGTALAYIGAGIAGGYGRGLIEQAMEKRKLRLMEREHEQTLELEGVRQQGRMDVERSRQSFEAEQNDLSHERGLEKSEVEHEQRLSELDIERKYRLQIEQTRDRNELQRLEMEMDRDDQRVTRDINAATERMRNAQNHAERLEAERHKNDLERVKVELENSRKLLDERQTREADARREEVGEYVQKPTGEYVGLTKAGTAKETGVRGMLPKSQQDEGKLVKQVVDLGEGNTRIVFGNGTTKDVGPDTPGPAGITRAEAEQRAQAEAESQAGYLSTDSSDFAAYGGNRERFITERALEIYEGKGGSGPRGRGMVPVAPEVRGGRQTPAGVIPMADADRLQRAGQLPIGALVMGRDGKVYEKTGPDRFEPYEQLE